MSCAESFRPSLRSYWPAARLTTRNILPYYFLRCYQISDAAPYAFDFRFRLRQYSDFKLLALMI